MKMEKLKIAKDDSIPTLKADGSNYVRWRSSYLGFYCCQIDTVMKIATTANEIDPSSEEKKMLTATIFKSIHADLRSVYVLNKDMLEDGYLLWTALETRFGDSDQAQKDLEAFLSFKQGSLSLRRFLTEYDNLRQRIGKAKLASLMNEDQLIRHLHRALSATARALFPHGVAKFDDVIRIMIANSLLQNDQGTPVALAASKTGVIRCYKCGQLGHHRRECTNELKCFNCNGTGHISKNCPKA